MERPLFVVLLKHLVSSSFEEQATGNLEHISRFKSVMCSTLSKHLMGSLVFSKKTLHQVFRGYIIVSFCLVT